MPCLHHTDENGPEEYFVTPFDPCPAIKCQCPGDCPGTLVLWHGSNGHLAFLQCSVCACGYVAADKTKEAEAGYGAGPKEPK